MNSSKGPFGGHYLGIPVHQPLFEVVPFFIYHSHLQSTNTFQVVPSLGFASHIQATNTPRGASNSAVSTSLGSR